MIRGKLTVVGTMDVDGEQLTGCFVECSIEELKNNKPMIYKEVEIKEAEKQERIEI